MSHVMSHVITHVMSNNDSCQCSLIYKNMFSKPYKDIFEEFALEVGDFALRKTTVILWPNLNILTMT